MDCKGIHNAEIVGMRDRIKYIHTKLLYTKYIVIDKKLRGFFFLFRYRHLECEPFVLWLTMLMH